MNKEEIIELFDNENYQIILDNIDINNSIFDYEVLYYLKSKLALNDFKIYDIYEIKKIVFYYFYLVWSVDFENNYSFTFNKNLLILDFKNLDNEIIKINNFKKYFNLWKNEIFLNKIKDNSIKDIIISYSEDAVEVNNIIDFFIYFTHECSELYAFSWEHFPLFKWLINELANYE